MITPEMLADHAQSLADSSTGKRLVLIRANLSEADLRWADLRGAAITEAERFLDLARELQAQAKHTDWIYVQGTAASGAARRASMDLTRALADLRRAG